ncbi:MAG: NUDIX domain-containing protein [Eubacterium sp.]|nr:NUDIX domain-containing protein [Eubacterium sp.]
MLRENADELWDLYTKDREKTGRTHRRGDPMPDGWYRMAVHVCIFNSQNQLLIQQRQPFKKDWPNMWDVSVGGSATAGDTSRDAAQREVWEELGLQVDLRKARPFFTMNFTNGFDDFYILEQDVDLSALRLQESEVKQVRWAGREEVRQMQERGLMIPYWFLDSLFTARHTHDAQGERLHTIAVMAAGTQHLESWMSLAQVLWTEAEAARHDDSGTAAFHRQNPESVKESMQAYQKKVLSHILERTAVCAVDGHMVVGFLLGSVQDKKTVQVAVHPQYRGHGIASRMRSYSALL